MNRFSRTKPHFIILAAFFSLGCGTAKNTFTQNRKLTVGEREAKLFDVQRLVPGIAAYGASEIAYQRNGQTILQIQFKEPKVVAVASKPEKWGYFQFPTIVRTRDNAMMIAWNLNPDAMEAYGSHKFGASLSKDGGKTWDSTTYDGQAGGFELPNGEKIKVYTPKPIKATDLTLPKSIGRGLADTYNNAYYDYYKLHDLPEQVNGVFLERLGKGSSKWKIERASLYDPQAARYVVRGMMPVVWWGDMHLANDKSLIAGVYPGFQITSKDSVDPYHQVFFYRSTDGGRSWKIQGRVPYLADTSTDKKGYQRMGYTEPAYEILPDGSFICVMRTTDGIGNGPMYSSRSTDQGVNWTKPEIIASSGVLPRLLQLKNGITVMAAGRPGVQLRFSTDGSGKAWTDAFEMLPYQDYSDQVSCGYTGLLPTGPDRFLIVYSDFKYPNKEGEPRKAIKVREVIVRPQK